MKAFKRIPFAAIVSILLGLGGFSVPCSAAITGDPATDSWTLKGNSASPANYNSGAAVYGADIYFTSFTLTASSPLISTAGGFNWNAGDSIVGVGGVFHGGTALTYDGPGGATNTRIVIKYGASGATWLAANSGPPGQPTNSPAFGSLANGGVGSILLGTAAYDFSPANSGTLIVPTDSPEEQTSANGTTPIDGHVGRVITYWNGTMLIGFESFVDLTLLDANYPTAAVLPGDQIILDLQEDTGAFEDSVVQGPPPVAVSQNVQTKRGFPLAITLTGTDAVTFTVATQPTNGTLSGTAPNLTYTPNANFVGNDSFTFTVSDGPRNSAPATVTIAVIEDDSAATAQSVDAVTGVPKAITLGGVADDTLTYDVVTQPVHGMLAGTAPNLTYTSDAKYVGFDSFTFKVNDGVSDSEPATVTITVLPPVYFSGTYVGLINGTDAADAGTIKLVSLGNGTFTGSIRYGGVTHAIKGRFDAAGNYSIDIGRKGQAEPIFSVTLGVTNGQDGLTGTVSDGVSTGQIVATNAIYSKANPSPQAGKYTILIPPDPAQTDGGVTPQGSGAGKLTVTMAGQLRFAGKLADGTAFTEGTTLTRNGVWYLFLPLYARTGTKAGMIQGTVQFENVAGSSDLDGPMTWIKPASSKAYYPNGFMANTVLIGSAFSPTGSFVVSDPNGVIFGASAGNLAQPIDDSTAHVVRTSAAALRLSGANHLGLSIAKATGLITGSFIHPLTGLRAPVNAVVFQKQAIASGFFLSLHPNEINESGSVELTIP